MTKDKEKEEVMQRKDTYFKIWYFTTAKDGTNPSAIQSVVSGSAINTGDRDIYLFLTRKEADHAQTKILANQQ